MDGLDLLYKHIVIRPILFDSSIKEIPKEAIRIRPKYECIITIFDYNVVRKYIVHNVIYELICRPHISHIGEDTILYIPDIYHIILRGYNIIKDNILHRIFTYTTHEYYGIIGRLKIQSEFPIIYEYVQILHIPYRIHDIILYAPYIYKYTNIDPIICGNIIISKSEPILSELNLIRNILFEPLIKCIQYIQVYEVFDFISAIDELQIAIREPKLICIDDADRTLSRTYRKVYYPYAQDIIQLLNTPYPLQLIIYHGLPPTIHDKDTLKYLKPSISIILNTSLQQYIKYPRIDILKMGVERINTLLGRRIITENDIIKAIQYTEKPLLQHIDSHGLYYLSEMPKTHILILRDKLSIDVKKSVSKLLKIIEDRYYKI